MHKPRLLNDGLLLNLYRNSKNSCSDFEDMMGEISDRSRTNTYQEVHLEHLHLEEVPTLNYLQSERKV